MTGMGMGSGGGGGNSDADRFMALVDMLSDPVRTKEHLAELVKQVESHKAAIDVAKREAAQVRADADAYAKKVRHDVDVTVDARLGAARSEEKRVDDYRVSAKDEMAAGRQNLDAATRSLEAAKEKVAARELAVQDRERKVSETEAAQKKLADELAVKRRRVEELARALA